MTKRISARSLSCIASIGLLCFLTPPAACAQPLPESEAAYEQALESIRNDDLPQAIARLESLRRQDPDHAGALLDLAYLYCQAGRKGRVEESLLILEAEFKPPPRIQALIHELRQRDCAPAREGTKWALAVAVGRDSNVNQGSSVRSFALGSGSNPTTVTLDDEFLPRPSLFLGVNAYLSHAVDERNSIYGAVSTQQYASADGFDQALLSVGHGHAFSGRGWQVSSDLNVALRTLGGILYQESFAGRLQALPPAAYRAGLPFGLDLRVAYSRYPTRAAFNSLETTFLIPAFWQFSERVSSRVSAGWMLDQARENRPGGDRSGPLLGAELFYRHSDAWKGYAGWQARFLDGELPYAPPLLEMVREQRQHFVSLAAERKFAGAGALRIEYQHTNSADTIPIYRFNSDSVVFYWIIEGRI